jgi:hypothetical protein
VHIVQARADLTTDFQDIAEALRGDHADTGCLTLDQRIGGHRGGMDHQAYRLAATLRALQRALNRGHEAEGRVNRGGRDFDDEDLSRGLIHQGTVGERAADIDAYAIGAHASVFPCAICAR